jgi:hypothetical protein
MRSCSWCIYNDRILRVAAYRLNWHPHDVGDAAIIRLLHLPVSVCHHSKYAMGRRTVLVHV